MAGKKITKKKLKEPDEFVNFAEHSYFWFARHAKKFATGGIIVLVVILAIFLFQKWEAGKERDAYQMFNVAMQNYGMASSPSASGSQPDYKNTLQMFDDVITKYSRTSAGKLSLLYKGNILLRLGQFDEAIKAYGLFLEKGVKERLFQSFAMEGLGYAYEGKKDYERALGAYQKLLEAGQSSEIGEAHLGMGRSYEKLGKTKEAVESYRAFLKTSQKSLMANMVLRKISLLEK